MLTEKDIFDFVFFPQNLSEEKQDRILKSSNFDGLIDFYSNLKSEINKQISESVREKLLEKINLYKVQKFFRLKLVEEPKAKRNSEFLVLAAASASGEPKITAQSFIDEQNHLLVRVIKSKDITRIYTFSTEDKALKNIKIKTLPSGKEFFMPDNSLHLEIKENLLISEVQIELD